jgi:hypothetical protein
MVFFDFCSKPQVSSRISLVIGLCLPWKFQLELFEVVLEEACCRISYRDDWHRISPPGEWAASACSCLSFRVAKSVVYFKIFLVLFLFKKIFKPNQIKLICGIFKTFV